MPLQQIPPRQLLPSSLAKKRTAWSLSTWIMVGLVILAVVIIVALTLYVLLTQGLAAGSATLTIVSIVAGMILSLVSLLINYFQWRSSVALEEQQLFTSTPTTTLPSLDITSSPTNILPSPSSLSTAPLSATSIRPNPDDERHVDWGEAPLLTHFYGREQELAQLKQWVVDDHCHVVVIQGMAGVGKTALASTFARQVADEFTYVFWRSLQNTPPLSVLLSRCLLFLSDQQTTAMPQDEEQVIQLINALRSQRCLLVLDNFESILSSGKRSGNYRHSYDNFGRLLDLIGSTHHQSCLLITTREQPHGLTRLEDSAHVVRVLALHGIAPTAARLLLRDRALSGSDQSWLRFISYYGGNPLALKLVAESIRELFQGDMLTFLDQKETIVDDIRELLDQQFLRLSSREQEILYWLAIERETTSLETLRSDILTAIPKGELQDALTSLLRRSLVENGGTKLFTLQPVILEYVTDRLVATLLQDLQTDQTAMFQRYALLKTQAKDYIRSIQHHLLLVPLAENLLANLGLPGCQEQIHILLTILRSATTPQIGYAAGNLLNLLIYLQLPLSDYDFSHLIIRQANFQGATLTDVNFLGADLATCAFTETFGNILCVAFAPGLDLLAASTTHGQIETWRISDGTPLLTITENSDWVRTIAFSPDGRLLASGGDDETVRIWNLHNGLCQTALHGHRERIYAVAFSPDGSTLATGGDDQAVHLWDLSSGRCIALLQGHTQRLRSLSFSADSCLLASAGEDCCIYLWDLATRQPVRVLQEHGDRVYSVALSSDGKLIVSGSDDETVRIWDSQTGQSLHTLHGHRGRIYAVALSQDDRYIVSAGHDQTIRVWDAHTATCLHVLLEHRNRVRSVAFNTLGTMIASGGDDQALHIWDLQSGQALKTLRGHSSWVYAVAFNSNGSMLASDNEDFTIRLWDPHTFQCLKMLRGHTSWINTIAFHPDGTLLATGSDDQSIRLWDTRTEQPAHVLNGHTGRVRSIAFSPDGTLLASGGDDQFIRVWEASSGRCLQLLHGHLDRIRAVAFVAQNTLISGGEDQLIRLWNIQQATCTHQLSGHTGRIWSVAYAPTHNLLASGSNDHTIRLWHIDPTDLQTPTTTQRSQNTQNAQNQPTLDTQPTQHTTMTTEIAEIIPQQQPTSSTDTSCLGILEGHTGRVYSVAFSPDGSLLASGSEDQTIRLWKISTHKCIKILTGHSSRIRSVAFSPTEPLLISGSHDGTVKLWSIADLTNNQAEDMHCLQTLQGDRPYERMNITAVRGITPAQKTMLKTLGAIENT